MNIFKTNKALRKNVKELGLLNDELNMAIRTMIDKATPELVIEKILKKEIKWFNSSKLKGEEYLVYYNEAQAILRSPVFKNEMDAYIGDLIKEIAMKAKDYKTVETLRYSINGVQALFERFGKIRKPDDRKREVKDPHSTF